ncbi:MAG: DUF4905 domain-containing protein [Bacteroidetes bacterium]|nr:DUF4905 domain-containing protein [Bacteroidota bacterium]
MLRPFIEYTFRFPVWRMEIDTLNDTLLVELRDQGDKRVYFSSLDLKTGKIHFDEFKPEERWLTGIETAHDGVLLLHNYQSDAGPAHKGLVAIDTTTGNILWHDYNLAFDHLSINGPVFYDVRLQPRKYLLGDIKTGATLRKHEPSIDLELSKELKLPDEISVEYALSLRLPVHPAGNAVHYVEHNNFRIVSLHAIADTRLQQHLFIMNDEEIIYHELLHADIQKLQPESFLLYKDQLISLKNQSQLEVLNL